MAFTFLYVTAKDKTEAQRIAQHLLKKKLIACANILPIESMYWWKGKIVKGKEVVLILKMVKDKVVLVQKEIERMHSYEVPCIAEIDVKVNEEYEGWMERQMK